MAKISTAKIHVRNETFNKIYTLPVILIGMFQKKNLLKLVLNLVLAIARKIN